MTAIRSVYQLLAGGTAGNAVVGEALAWQAALRGWGLRAQTFAAEVHPSLARTVLPLTRCKPTPADVLILHYTTDSAASDFARQAPSPLVLRYHNVTPPDYLRGIAGSLAAQAERGRARLSLLHERTWLALADSAYNERDLKEVGFAHTGILPVLVPNDLLRVEPDVDVLMRFAPTPEGKQTNLLFVGRVVPNKCHEDIIKVFYFYHQINPWSQLWFVGAYANTARYADWLHQLAAWLDLGEAVHFAGHVSPALLAAYYRSADVFVSMSEHEGFGVPLVESMRFDVPIVAYASAAIPETLGGAGVLIRQKNFPVIAELIHLLQTDADLHARIVARQRERAGDFEPSCILEQFRKRVDAVINAHA